MSRTNTKETELRAFADMILSAEDYSTIIQRLNGTRMGLTNQYKHIPDDRLDKITKLKRLKILKDLVETYK